MKKMFIAGFAALASVAAFAAANDVLITFSTPGPDTYADGTTVLDGERYALCWSKDFAKFAINADGTVENGYMVIAAPVAKGGRCPTVVFEVSAANAESKYKGGKWAVYLLDTRKFGSDGSVALAGNTKTINTVGKVGDAFSASTGSAASVAGGDAAASASEIASGVEVAKPEITGFKVVDGYIYMTVKGTVPFLAYGIAEGAAPDAVATPVGDAGRGAATTDEEITLIAPANGESGFFQVQRRR